MKIRILIFVFCLINCLFFGQKNVDAIYHQGKIYTINSSFEIQEAMAVKDGRVLAIGSNVEILNQYFANEYVDLKQKSVYPAFIDAHCHFTGFATDLWKCELWGTQSWEEVISRLENYAKTTTQFWIYGRSWDQNDWQIKKFPNKKILDDLFPNRPVYLKRIDGHAAIANQFALDLAKINTHTKINGGKILTENEELTGVLLDNAMLLVEKLIPEIEDNLALTYYKDVQKICFANGLSSVHDCGISEETIARLEKMQTNKDLKINIYALLENNPKYYKTWIPKGRYQNGKLTVGGFKVYADGALGSRGAFLHQEYSDQKDWKGFLLSDEVKFKDLANLLENTDLQLCTHAIGDATNSIILKIYANVLKKKNKKRWRIEHAQIVNKKDYKYFRKYQIIPSVQPTHATSDMYWVESRLGKKRLQNAYAYKNLLKQNKWLPLGTDFPVEQINPISTFYAAVYRKDSHNFPVDGFLFKNALTRKEAIQGMTIWAAKAAFQEKERGSLEPGKVADFVILDQDILEINEKDILKTKVIACYVDGDLVYNIENP